MDKNENSEIQNPFFLKNCRMIKQLFILSLIGTSCIIIYLLINILIWFKFYDWNIPNVFIRIFNLIIQSPLNLILGTGIIIFAIINLSKISSQFSYTYDQNHQIKNMITNGYYSKVRHPMYSMFMIIILGVFYIWESIIIPFFAFIVMSSTALNGIYEEYKILIPKFKADYLKYMDSVPNRFFPLSYKCILSIFISVYIIGLFF
ncbi:MAG: hypothetical protein JXA99_17680 [Candidatus Lokiarchaeota archaeon]|nr:hypothetical protein [Candidatus Lokiarchaeota archaeon]